jgi:lipoyl(octanoyl) transferase
VVNQQSEMNLVEHVIVRQLGRQPYQPVWQAMSRFTDERNDTTPDELWLVEHDPVFTQGQAGKAEHILAAGDIPVVQVDRGGQVTYHGPGQQVVYFLINLRRKGLGVRDLVSSIEDAIVDMLEELNIAAHARPDAPGVYVASGAKICSLGLRIRRGCSFHGLALNVGLDLEPFLRINPCGYAGMEVTRICDQGGPASLSEVEPLLIKHLMDNLGYNTRSEQAGGI